MADQLQTHLSRLNINWTRQLPVDRAWTVMVDRYMGTLDQIWDSSPSQQLAGARIHHFSRLLIAELNVQGSTWKESTFELEAAIDRISPEFVLSAFQQAMTITDSPSKQSNSNAARPLGSSTSNPRQTTPFRSLLNAAPLNPSSTRADRKLSAQA